MIVLGPLEPITKLLSQADGQDVWRTHSRSGHFQVHPGFCFLWGRFASSGRMVMGSAVVCFPSQSRKADNPTSFQRCQWLVWAVPTATKRPSPHQTQLPVLLAWPPWQNLQGRAGGWGRWTRTQVRMLPSPTLLTQRPAVFQALMLLRSPELQNGCFCQFCSASKTFFQEWISELPHSDLARSPTPLLFQT